MRSRFLRHFRDFFMTASMGALLFTIATPRSADAVNHFRPSPNPAPNQKGPKTNGSCATGAAQRFTNFALNGITSASSSPSFERFSITPAPNRMTEDFAPMRKVPATPVVVEANPTLGVMLNGTWVTKDAGPRGFHVQESPNPLHDLGFFQDDLYDFLNEPILSVGEGAGLVVPYLKRLGLKARGLDLWYDEAVIQKLKEVDPEGKHSGYLVEYYNRHKQNLVAGSVFDIPYQNESIKLVVAKYLINNIETQRDKFRALDEMVRVLKVDGEARILQLAEPGSFDERLLVKVLSERYGGKVSVELRFGNLLILKKLRRG
ncbi:MAG: methyltransferase domain-containing protein [Bdellovibrionota bacterium]